jgi:hypothetical protein
MSPKMLLAMQLRKQTPTVDKAADHGVAFVMTIVLGVDRLRVGGAFGQGSRVKAKPGLLPLIETECPLLRLHP